MKITITHLILLAGLCVFCLSYATNAHAQGEQLVQERCTVCHSTDRICRKLGNASEEQFKSLVQRMRGNGAQVSDKEQTIIAKYLALLSAGAAPLCPASASSSAQHADSSTASSLPKVVLLGHPLLMTATILLALFVLYLGAQRSLQQHFGRKAVFQWKRHVKLGYLTMILFLAGMLGGMGVIYLQNGVVGVTGLHFLGAMTMLPFILIGVFTGRIMDRNKQRRKALPILHGLNNLAMLALAFFQLATGLLMLIHHLA